MSKPGGPCQGEKNTGVFPPCVPCTQVNLDAGVQTGTPSPVNFQIAKGFTAHVFLRSLQIWVQILTQPLNPLCDLNLISLSFHFLVCDEDNNAYFLIW